MLMGSFAMPLAPLFTIIVPGSTTSPTCFAGVLSGCSTWNCHVRQKDKLMKFFCVPEEKRK